MKTATIIVSLLLASCTSMTEEQEAEIGKQLAPVAVKAVAPHVMPIVGIMKLLESLKRQKQQDEPKPIPNIKELYKDQRMVSYVQKSGLGSTSANAPQTTKSTGCITLPNGVMIAR